MTNPPILPDPQTARAMADTLAVHKRVNPPGGRCLCGHEVPLGHRFTLHQVDALIAAPATQDLLQGLLDRDRCEHAPHPLTTRFNGGDPVYTCDGCDRIVGRVPMEGRNT